MIRAGEGIVINYDGTGGEIAVSTPQWFVAEITGTVSATTPVNHKWKKKVPKKDGKTFEDANPPVIGDGTANPAYLPALATGTTSTATASGLVFMRLRSTNDSGQCVYEIIGSAGATAGGGGGGGGGNAVIDVVTDVQCGPEGLTLSTVTFSGADYDNAVIRNFLALSDVTAKSYTANQGRAVVVNAEQTGLEFGAIVGEAADTFIALTDTPQSYGSNAYKVLTVSSTNAGVSFSNNDITTKNSIKGGGNPNNPTTYAKIELVNDTASPSPFNFYGTDSGSIRGFYSISFKNLNDTPDSYSGSGGKFLQVNEGGTAIDFAAIDLDTLQADLATAQGDITTLQADLATAQGDITTLQADLATAQGDITTLQADLAALDGRVTALEGA